MERIFTDLKYKALAILFVAVMIISFVMLDSEAASPVTTTMKSATLPVIMMKTSSGTLYNELHGYTSDVDIHLMNDTITPLQDNRHLNVIVNTYGENIESLSYKIRKLGDMSLIEDTRVTDYTSDGDYLDAVFKVKNLIDNDTEYLMQVIIKTDKHNEISYYTKIFCSQDIKMQEKLDFILNFNSWTFNQNELDKISQYIETKSTGDNTNYGKVNINSSKAQIGWGDLNPVVEGNIIPSIKSMTAELASVSLRYTMAAQSEQGNYDSYNVDEYYRIRQSGDKMYLLNYEREANQIFDSRNDLMGSSRINLGISSTQSERVVNSSNSRFTCFVRQSDLWSFDNGSSTFTRVFSFDDESSDGVRERYPDHNIKVMEVDDDGNIHFIVYGYMNRGEHEGEVGVSLCRYDAKKNDVSELIYIPVDVPYDVLSENVGEVAYIGANGAFYILLDDSLYSIDLTSKEKMTEISGLTDETYAVSENGTAIAYSLNGQIYNTDTIRIFDMASGTDYQIKARQGDRLRVIGYIRNDFVYGEAHADDIVRYSNGGVMFPMYRIAIMDSGNNLIKEYQNDGIYVSTVTVQGMRLNLTRVVKNGDGDYETTSVDQLLNREENVQDAGAYVEVVATQSRKKELYIDLVNKVKSAAMASMKTSSSVQFSSGEIIRVDTKLANDSRYYVYGYGRFQGSFVSLEKAIAAADSTYGNVLDIQGREVWRRYKPSSMSLGGINAFYKQSSQTFAGGIDIMLSMAGLSSDAQAGFDSGKNALEIINATGVTALNLQGASLDNVLSIVGTSRPVVGRYGADSYVVIKAYDSKNVTFYDVASGQEVTQTIGEASKLFEQWGNIFVSYIR